LENLEKILKNKKIIAILICMILLMGIGIFLYLQNNQYESIDSTEILEEMENEINQSNLNNEIKNNQKEANSTNNNEMQEETDEEKIAIHITGEVKRKGILYLDKGARIADAIREAGGTTKNANLDEVNLAYVLEDGQKIYIPNKKEKIEAGAYIIANSGNNVLVEEGKSNNNNTNVNKNVNTKGVKGKVNINSANQTELETLPGIGPSLAQRIIEYRQSNGNFQKIEDIQNVKGIGDSKYSNIKENICI